MKTVQKVLGIVLRIGEWCLIAVAVLVAALLLFGIHPYAVKTGSMEPTIPVGSLCFVNQRAAFAQVCEGDIITFKAGDMLVTHRVVEIAPEGITTRGDANHIADASKVTGENYIGKVVFWLPFIGKVLLFCQTQTGRIVCVIVIFLLGAVIFYEYRSSKRTDEEDASCEEQAPSDEEDTRL